MPKLCLTDEEINDLMMAVAMSDGVPSNTVNRLIPMISNMALEAAAKTCLERVCVERLKDLYCYDFCDHDSCYLMIKKAQDIRAMKFEEADVVSLRDKNHG